MPAAVLKINSFFANAKTAAPETAYSAANGNRAAAIPIPRPDMRKARAELFCAGFSTVAYGIPERYPSTDTLKNSTTPATAPASSTTMIE